MDTLPGTGTMPTEGTCCPGCCWSWRKEGGDMLKNLILKIIAPNYSDIRGSQDQCKALTFAHNIERTGNTPEKKLCTL
jgi:hypothetical protein